MPAIEQENILHRLFVFFFFKYFISLLILLLPSWCIDNATATENIHTKMHFSSNYVHFFDSIDSEKWCTFYFWVFLCHCFFLLFCSGFACIFVNQTWYGMKWNAFVDTKNWFWLFILWIAFEFGLNIYFVYLLRFTDEKSLYWVKTI